MKPASAGPTSRPTSRRSGLAKIANRRATAHARRHRGLAVACASLATSVPAAAAHAARQTEIAVDLLQLGGGLIQRCCRSKVVDRASIAAVPVIALGSCALTRRAVMQPAARRGRLRWPSSCSSESSVAYVSTRVRIVCTHDACLLLVTVLKYGR
eukprot:157586-Prymnesium_polylepis.1